MYYSKPKKRPIAYIQAMLLQWGREARVRYEKETTPEKKEIMLALNEVLGV
jgi:hypothetical protein